MNNTKEEEREKPEAKTNSKSNEFFKMNLPNSNEAWKSKEKFSSNTKFKEFENFECPSNTMNALNNTNHKNIFFTL
jgi:hypothetical protein